MISSQKLQKQTLSRCSTQEDLLNPQDQEFSAPGYLDFSKIPPHNLQKQSSQPETPKKILVKKESPLSTPTKKSPSTQRDSSTDSQNNNNSASKIKKKRPLKLFTLNDQNNLNKNNENNNNNTSNNDQKSEVQRNQNKIFSPKQGQNIENKKDNNNNFLCKLALFCVNFGFVVTIFVLKSLFYKCPKKFVIRIIKAVKQYNKILIREIKKEHKKLNLILDLDETLIHACKKPYLNYGTYHQISVKKNGQLQDYYIYERPYMREFIDQLSQKYNIYIYTASYKEYADEIIRKIVDPFQKNLIQGSFYRESCIFFNNSVSGKVSLTKSLKKIGMKKANSIFIDNCIGNLQEDLDQAFQIDSYKGQQEDTALFNYFIVLSGICKQFSNNHSLVQLIKKAKLRLL